MITLPNIVLATDTTILFRDGELALLRGTLSYPFYANIFSADRTIIERIQITGEASTDVATVIRGVDNTPIREWTNYAEINIYSTMLAVDGKDVAPMSIGLTGTSATSATTGAMTVPMKTRIITVTPSGNCTFNATGGVLGQVVTFIITTSGTVSRTLTFGAGFKPVGTLATGTTNARRFCVSFIYDGTAWIETARTAAIP